MSKNKIVLVTGANRGLGRQAARDLAAKGYRVLAAGRNSSQGEQVIQTIRKQGHEAEWVTLDVTRPADFDSLLDWMNRNVSHLDALVNNAGVFFELSDPREPGKASARDVSSEDVLKTFETNALGPYRLIQAMLPNLEKSDAPRIVNVSSGMGGLTEMGPSWPGYRISKAALNAVTRVFSQELEEKFKINSVCPGWVRTEMGGENASRSVEEGADTIVWAATLPPDGPTGEFLRDRAPIAW